MHKAPLIVSSLGLFALSLVALAQTAATLTGVTQVSNATTALRLLQCYRESPSAPVTCDLQVTNTQPDQALALNLAVNQVIAVASGKTIPASSIKAQEQRTAAQKISLIIDPRSSKRFSASFAVPQTVATLNALRVGGFQFTDAAIAKSKPSAALSSVQVLDASQLNFAIGSYQFTFKGFTEIFNGGMQVNYDVMSTAGREEALGAYDISVRIFDSTGGQYRTMLLSWSTGSGQDKISVPPGVSFQVKTQFGNATGYSNGLFKLVGTTITKYLELTVNGETRTFQNVDLRPLAR